LRRPGTAKKKQRLFYALADPTRRSILEILASKGQMSATEVYGNFSASQPAISQHLKVLREADLVNVEKQAQKHIYRLNPEKVRDLEMWARQTLRLWEDRFEELDRVLELEKKRVAGEGDN
jgi:DNA-binding transcriptional ArsR family regulator